MMSSKVPKDSISSQAFILVDNLVVGYNKACVHPISFKIANPGIYAICGPNGSGKSTFLKTLIGLIPPIAGSFQLFHFKKIAYVPQAHTVNKYFHLSLRDFVTQGYGPSSSITSKDKLQIESYVNEWQLSEQIQKCFHELSGGQQTRAMIVRALISKPEIVFLDEPLASLDSCCQIQLMQTLFNLAQKEGVYVFIIDHHLEKFEDLVKGWLNFSKHHDDAAATFSI